MGNSLVDLLGWTLVHFLWQGAIVAGALWIVLRRLSKKPATLRYGSCGIALILLALAPAVTLAVLIVQRQAASGDVVIVVDSMAQARRVVAASGGSAIISGGEPALQKWLPTFVAIWAFGVALLSIRLLGGLYLVERLRRRFCLPAPPDWQDRLNALAERLAIRRRVVLAVSQRTGIPTTIGVFRTFVILPASIFTKLSPDQIEVVLVHELAHVARHDYLVNLLQSILETLLFYHPAVWWVSRVARLEREHCCDDVVVRVAGGPAFYAHTLAQLEERRRVPSLTLSATGGPLMNRIRRILGLSSAPLRPSAVLATAVLLLGMIVLLGSAIGARASAADQKLDATAQAKAHKKEHAKKVIVVRKVHAKATGTTTTVQLTYRAALGLTASPTKTTSAARATAAAPVRLSFTTKAKVDGPTRSPDGKVRIDARDEPFAEVVRTMCKQLSVPCVVAPGNYTAVSLTLDGVALTPAFESVCYAAGAQYDIVDGVFRFRPAKGSATGYGAEDESSTGLVTVQFKNAKFAEALTTVAEKLGISAVVQPGNYPEINVVLSRVQAPAALQALCAAGSASYEVRGGVYYFKPANK